MANSEYCLLLLQSNRLEELQEYLISCIKTQKKVLEPPPQITIAGFSFDNDLLLQKGETYAFDFNNMTKKATITRMD